MYSVLNDRAVIKITGEDRFKFLQGLLTNDVNKLNQNESIYACMLTAQGKYFADFFLKLDGDAILADIPKVRGEAILKKLNIYRLRSQVNIAECQEYLVIALLNNDKFEGAFVDPRLAALGMRAYTIAIDIALTHMQDAYDLLRIENFVAEGEKDLVPEQSFILEYGLDHLNAIDFKKGCYVGQELVARTHYRGAIRKQIAQIEAVSDLPPLGTEIYANEQKLGIICSSVKNKGLGLVRTEEVLALKPTDVITAANQVVNLKLKGSE